MAAAWNSRIGAFPELGIPALRPLALGAAVQGRGLRFLGVWPPAILLTDDAVLAELGVRIAARRVELQLTQAAVAEQAGIAKRTLERMEAGQTSQLSTLVRVLRVLGAASGLDGLIPESEPSPMALLRQKGKVRQRASGKRAAQAAGAIRAVHPAGPPRQAAFEER